MIIEQSNNPYTDYLSNSSLEPRFLCGNALSILRLFPEESIDCCVSSPPYWAKRQSLSQEIGLEKDYQEYIQNLTTILAEVKRILKKTGSLWLNIGDSYHHKNLVGIPW